MQALQTVTVQHHRAKSPRVVRISRKVKAVIDLMVHDCQKRSIAAQAIGLKDDTMRKALLLPHVMAYLNTQQDLIRTSAVARTISKAEQLMDSARSEHVQLQAVQYLNPPVQRSENIHLHQHLIPGLTVMRTGLPEPGDDALLIGDQRAKPRIAHEIKRIGTPVPHPEDRNVEIAPSSTSDSRGPKRASRGVK